jgi:hypothetical protein
MTPFHVQSIQHLAAMAPENRLAEAATIRPTRPPRSIGFYWYPRRGLLRDLILAVRTPPRSPRGRPD